MVKELQIILSPIEAFDEQTIKQKLAQEIGVSIVDISFYKVLKKSIDARSKHIKILLSVKVYIKEFPTEVFKPTFHYKEASDKNKVIIIGAGPAGLFCALKLLEKGIKPIIFERGKDVRSRRRDLAVINKEGIVNPDSNYCFGEGGAGTYSDGKLYTRSTKRGDVNRILEILVSHGADENILIEAHPHIGTNKLPNIIINIRNTILAHGGEINFNSNVQDLIIKDNAVKGIVTSAGKECLAEHVVIATGHSARGIYEMLYKKGIYIEQKPFAVGVRVEHPQDLVDSIQYHCSLNNIAETRKYLPAASYSLVHQIGGRGVYSFCMCPGGIIAACATDKNEVVTNGWSPSKRNNPFANSGIVVSVTNTDFKAYANRGPLAGLEYQKNIEQMAFKWGGGNLVAPAQRLSDFVSRKESINLPINSYQPGTKTTSLHSALPKEISNALQEGFKAFGKKMKGYLTNEAIIVGVESRTSSPVKIPRNISSLEHVQISGLYPCGEGAGYAGGIVSAAIDGEKVAEAIFIKKN